MRRRRNRRSCVGTCLQRKKYANRRLFRQEVPGSAELASLFLGRSVFDARTERFRKLARRHLRIEIVANEWVHGVNLCIR